MTKLLKANFYKLIKERSTYILMAISVAIALLVIFIYYTFGNVSGNGVEIRGIVNGETLFINGIQLGSNIGIIVALGISLYIGKEFSQNTIRNKIVIGYSKTKIYLSNLILSLLVGTALYLSYQVIIFSIAVPLFGWNDSFVFSEFIRLVINSLCILFSFSAVLNMISMLSRNMVAGILISIIMVVFSVVFFSAIQMIPLDGGAKTFVDIFTKSNFLGQSILIGKNKTVEFMIWCMVSAAIITAGSAVLGSALFEKMDVK